MFFATFAVQWFAAGHGRSRSRARVLGLGVPRRGDLRGAPRLVFPGMPGFSGPGSTERGITTGCSPAVDGRALVWAVLPPRAHGRLLGRATLLAPHLAAVAAFVALDVVLPGDRAFFFVRGRASRPSSVALERPRAAAALAGVILHSRVARLGDDRAAGTMAAALAVTVLCGALARGVPAPVRPGAPARAHLPLLAFFLIFRTLFIGAVVRPHQELVRLQSHIENELHVTIAELRQTKESREDLMRAVSHDLRNPLQMVLLKAEILGRRGKDSEAVQAGVRAILAAARRMERMLRDLADSARLEGGAMLKLERAPVNVAPSWRRCWTTQGVFEPARLEIAVPDGLPAVLADPDRLDRILVNLVGNALKYSAGR